MAFLFRLQRKRIFWQIRYYLTTAIFFTNKLFFKANEQSRLVKEHFSITKELLRLVTKTALYSVAVLFLCKGLEHLLVTYTGILNNPFLSGLQEKIGNSFPAFITLFSIIASISGLFLGLYFTAISVVTSTYARLPDNIRNLLLKEKVGTFYISILSTTTVLSILVIAHKVFGGNPGIVLSIFVLLSGCFGIFCFSLLGIRAFFFFDPSNFGGALFQDIIESIKLSTISDFKCFDINFQAYCQKIASKNIKTLKTLIEICIKEKHLQETSLLSILIRTIQLLKTYQTERSKIPSDSRWYSRVPVHKNWFLSNASTFSIAMETHSIIEPDMVPNTYWFEDTLTEIFEYSLRNMITQNNIQLACDFLNSLCGYFEKTGHDLEIENNLRIIERLGSILDDYFYSLSPDGKPEKYEDTQFALLEVWSVCIMSAPLGFYRLSRELNVDDLIKRIDHIDWENKSNLYKSKFPPLLLSRLEYIQKRLRFERLIEGKTITPSWYKRQLISTRYIDICKECVDKLVDSLNSVFISKSQAFIDKELSLFAALFSKRGLETCSKMRANFPHLKRGIDQIIKSEMMIKDILCPDIDWDSIKSKINVSYDKLVEIQAKCLPALFLIERPKNWPDIFGQTYNTVCHETYKSMVEKNTAKFSALFPLLFFGAIAASENLRRELIGRDVETVVSFVSEPLLDLLNLSGYAKTYSELYTESKIWQTCTSVWDNYLKQNKDVKLLIEKLVKLQEYRKNKFQIFPRDSLRTNWELSLKRKLMEMNVIDDMLGSSHPWGRSKVKHRSTFIRALCPGRYMHFVSAAEVFILTYLLKHPDARDIEFKDHSDLNKNIEHEEKEEEDKDNG